MSIFFASLATGVLLWLSLPPFPFGFLAWVAFVPVLISVRRESAPLRLFIHGFVAAVIPVTGVVYGLVPFSLLYSLSLVLLLPLYFGFFAWFYQTINRRSGKQLWLCLLLPSLWVVTEYGLTQLPLSTPLHLGSSQSRYPVVIQIADIGGIYGVGFLILLVNELLSRRSVAALVIPLMMVAYGTYRMNQVPTPVKTLSAALIQPVIPTEDYRDHWIDPRVRVEVQGRLASLTEAAPEGLDFLVWPEGGNGYLNLRVPPLRKQIKAWTHRKQSAFLLSSLDMDEEGHRFNSIFSLDSEGRVWDRYDKYSLAPLGEKHLTAGNSLGLLKTPAGPVGVLICFESVFSSMARRLKAQGASFLLISTSDAPFRNSSLPLLHSTLAIFRAIENRITVVQASNTGPSLVVDPWGRVLEEMPFYRVGTFVVKVPIYGISSPYSMIGEWWLILPVLYLVFAGWTAFSRKREPRGISRDGGRITKTGVLGLGTGLAVLALIVPIISLGMISWGSEEINRGEVLRFFSKRPPSLVTYRLHLKDFLQRGSNTCGPASLSLLLDYFGIEEDQERIEANLQMTDEGTSMAELARFAEGAGLRAQGERQNFARLMTVPKPLIAFINRRHFIVVFGADRDSVTFFDPAISNDLFHMDRVPFENVWSGEVLRLLPKPL